MARQKAVRAQVVGDKEEKKSKVKEVVEVIKDNKKKNDEKQEKREEKKAQQQNPQRQQQVEAQRRVVADKPQQDKDKEKAKDKKTKEKEEEKKKNVVIKDKKDEDREKKLKENKEKEKKNKDKTTKQEEKEKKEDKNKTGKKDDPKKEDKKNNKNEKEKQKEKEKEEKEKKRDKDRKDKQEKESQKRQVKKHVEPGTKVRPQKPKKVENKKDEKEKKNKVKSSKQPLVVSLFKSKLGGTWEPSNNIDLKFKLYKAKFSTIGIANFYNSQLDYENFGETLLKQNPLIVLSRQASFDFSAPIPVTSQLKKGALIYQEATQSTGRIVYTTGSVGVGTTSLTYRNTGIGLTPSSGIHTYTNVSFVSVPETFEGLPLNKLGSGLVGDIVVNNGTISQVNVTAGGTSYNVGDIVLANIGVSDNVSFTVGIVTAVRGILVEDIQGDFNKNDQLTILTGAGTTLGFATGIALSNDPEDSIQFIREGSVIRVEHKNHGMHAKNNLVEIDGVIGDLPPVELVSSLSSNATGNVTLTSVGILTTFEQVSVSSTNPGYIKIADELIKYNSVNTATNTISIIERRCLDGFNKSTFGKDYSAGAKVRKYELSGVSLMRINRYHDFNDVDGGNEDIDKPDITLDRYYIKINKGTQGGKSTERRKGYTTLPVLYFSDTKECGGKNVIASKNIQFETLTPIVQTFTPAGTKITGRARTVTGTSAGNQAQLSFIDKGFDDIQLNKINTFDSPRLITSVVNENEFLQDFPGRRSLTVETIMSTNDTDVSPVIDLDRVFAITTTNRINSPYNDDDLVYLNGNKVKKLNDNDHDCIYLSKVVRLQNPATSLRVEFAGFRPPGTNFRTFFKVFRSDSASKYQRFIPFNSKGTPDKDPGVSNANTPVLKDFDDYLYTVADLPDFDSFQIKIVMLSKNQASVPLIKDLRVLALA